MKKNILITGCSSGLGFALTQLYLEQKYTVYGISRNHPDINHDSFHFIPCDLSKTVLIKETLSNELTQIASFDVVYLNAGMLGNIDTMEELSLKDLKATMELNVYANKELLDILSHLTVKTVIGISSGASVNGSKGWGAYSLSKASLNMLISLYSKEMTNSKLFAVAPGVIETPMTDIIRFEIDDEAFPSAKILKEGTIQTPNQAAQRLYEFVQKSDTFESGSFLDVRKI